MDLDHVFVFVDDGPAAERAAVAAGLAPTHRRRHAGQGTETVCFGFANAYLELIWVADHDEITAPAVRRTGLWPRSQWRSTGACPFGACLRGVAPFPTWTYGVPFPPGVTVEVAADSDNAAHPLLFAFPGVGAPPFTDQPLGRAITGVALAYPGATPDRVPALTAAGITERPAPEPRLVLTLDGGRRGQAVDVPQALLQLRL